MPGQGSRRPLMVNKDTTESYYSMCLTLDNVVLLVSFFCVNVVAFIVRLDLATMMMVPNIFVLYQMGLVDQMKGCGLALLAVAIMALISTDSFYILATHCLFYLTILLVSGQIQEEEQKIN